VVGAPIDLTAAGQLSLSADAVYEIVYAVAADIRQYTIELAAG